MEVGETSRLDVHERSALGGVVVVMAVTLWQVSCGPCPGRIRSGLVFGPTPASSGWAAGTLRAGGALIVPPGVLILVVVVAVRQRD